MNLKQLKTEAKICIRGNYWTLLKPQIIIWILQATISTLFASIAIGQIGFDALTSYEASDITNMILNSTTMDIASIVSLLLAAPLNYGLNNYYNEFDKNDFVDINTIFKPYKFIIKIFVITLFTNFIISIGSTFLIIPGIIFACIFSIIPYAYAKHPELGVMEMIIHAWKMMKGHKMEYILLELSFIGWLLLGVFTCGVALLWVMPYYKMTMVKYFNMIDEAYNQISYTTIHE